MARRRRRRRGRRPERGLPDRPGARGPEFARLGAGGEPCEPGEEVAEPVNGQDDERPSGSVGGDPPGHRRAQPADDEAKSLAEAERGGRGLHDLLIRPNSWDLQENSTQNSREKCGIKPTKPHKTVGGSVRKIERSAV
jgi:hypothetical protein